MIIGIGVDLVEVERIEAAVRRHGQRFLDRIYTADELAYCAGYLKPGERWAARFAAKEAAMKALGTGWRGVGWRDFEVARSPTGPPRLILHGPAAALARQRGLQVVAESLA
jgi:holo-[acyl-carrier protein] synthase